MHILTLETLQRLDFQYVPNDMTLSSSANVEDIEIVGRNLPIHHTSGGSDDITFELDFFAQEKTRSDVLKKVNFLRSLRYSQGPNRGTERIKIVWGNMYKNEVWVLKSLSVKLTGFARNHGFLPQQAKVTLQLSLDSDKNLFANDIRG